MKAPRLAFNNSSIVSYFQSIGFKSALKPASKSLMIVISFQSIGIETAQPARTPTREDSGTLRFNMRKFKADAKPDPPKDWTFFHTVGAVQA